MNTAGHGDAPPDTQWGRQPRRWPAHWATLALPFTLFTAVLVRGTWMADDAYITLRTIDNFWNGYGLRWNIVERVQAYTHPLWMILVGAFYGITREAYFTTLLVSWACTIGTVALFFRRRPPVSAASAVLVLASSRAFVDYSTSGLENPLAHLLLSAFWLDCLATDVLPAAPALASRRLQRLGLLAALGALTRLDLLLLMTPGLIVAARRLPRSSAIRALALAATPLAAWHMFTVTYYGFLVPNTAYAKLGHGLSSREMLMQGLFYLYESLTSDPVTLASIGVALVAVIWMVRRAGRTRAMFGALGCGLLAHMTYITWAGGDYMSGRMLTPAFVCAIVLLTHVMPRDDRSVRPTYAAVAIALLVSFSVPTSPLRVWSALPRGTEDPHVYRGIVDERAFYYAYTGLVPRLRGARLAEYPWATHGRFIWGSPRVTEYPAIGFLGYYGGPAVHIVDPVALADPLAAHLPAEPHSRIGHFTRRLPAGYVATLERCIARRYPRRAFVGSPPTCLALWDEVNQIKDPAIARRYHELARITQGPIFDRDRLWAILLWNLRWGGRQ